ncbi:hypothetical protein LZ31DRAFT_356094 [Colletotrichum somersetense]|nr:hypothetical protein LZ31DRAFT_356094 [Colletotrichum somersetense]
MRPTWTAFTTSTSTLMASAYLRTVTAITTTTTTTKAAIRRRSRRCCSHRHTTHTLVIWAGTFAVSEPLVHMKREDCTPSSQTKTVWGMSHTLEPHRVPCRDGHQPLSGTPSTMADPHSAMLHTASISDRASHDPWGHEPCPANVHRSPSYPWGN